MADKQVVQASSPKRAQPAAAAPAAPVAPARANMMVQLRQFGNGHRLAKKAGIAQGRGGHFAHRPDHVHAFRQRVLERTVEAKRVRHVVHQNRAGIQVFR